MAPYSEMSFLNDEGSEDSSDEETNFNPREICISQRTATLKIMMVQSKKFD